jgi:hypothetical protein
MIDKYSTDFNIILKRRTMEWSGFPQSGGGRKDDTPSAKH